MPIWTTFLADDLARGAAVGTIRQQTALATGAVHKNNRPRNDAIDLANHQSAATAELAGYYCLECRYWNELADTSKPKQPDLDHFIDVKERYGVDHHLIVALTDNPAWVYLSVWRDGSTFCVDRWCFGEEIMRERYYKSLVAGRPAYCAQMHEPFMKDSLVLRELVRNDRYRSRLAEIAARPVSARAIFRMDQGS